MQSTIWMFFSGLCAVTALLFYVALRRYWLMGRGKYRMRSFKPARFMLWIICLILALVGAVGFGLQGWSLVWADSLNDRATWLFSASVLLFAFAYSSMRKHSAYWGFYKVKRSLGIRMP